MPKQKRKRTAAEKRRKETMIIFINGKQKRVKRPPEGVDEFTWRNADPIWLHQNEMWEYIEPRPVEVAPRGGDWEAEVFDVDAVNAELALAGEMSFHSSPPKVSEVLAANYYPW